MLQAAVTCVVDTEQSRGIEDVQSHAAFVAGVLAVPEAEARQYVQWRTQGGTDGLEIAALTALARKGKWQ
jgi:hypothetical protein